MSKIGENIEKVVERPYTLRRLKDSDLFPLLQLLRKLGVKDLKEVILNAKDKVKFNASGYDSEEEKKEALLKLQESQGIDVVLDIAELLISKLDTHSNDIYEFYSRLAGIPADEIKEMEFGTLPLMIYDSFSEVKNTTFFKVAFKLL